MSNNMSNSNTLFTPPPQVGQTLEQMEQFIETAKQKKIEDMKQRNKDFLKPAFD